ncbi:15693_t:CDS:1, partial [Dentiscutata heterogama]
GGSDAIVVVENKVNADKANADKADANETNIVIIKEVDDINTNNETSINK